jgi:hypothetical protein
MKPTKQRRVSRQHRSVVAPVWENELLEILKQPVFLVTFAFSDPPRAITDALERLCKVLGNLNSVMTTELSTSTLKKAHGMLILLLGYNMSIQCARTFSSSQANRDLTTLLCRCLHLFHLSVRTQATLSVEDCTETFWFLTQVTLCLGRVDELEAPLGHCLSILERLSPKITSRLPMDQCRYLCLFLLRICVGKSAIQLRPQSLRLLQALEQHNCSHTARYARTALDAADGHPESSISSTYGHCHTLFSWICAAQSCSGATKLAETPGVVEQLRNIALEYGSDLSLAVQAADCLSSIAENHPSCTASLLRIILDILVEAPMVVRERILPGLCSAHGRDGLIKLLSWDDSERLKRTISSLVEVILVKRKAIDYIEKDIQGIVSILLDCMTYDDTRRDSHTTGCISHRDWASICIVLLESEKDPIVQLVVNRLCERLLGERDQIVHHSPQILTGLAEVLQSSFTAQATKLTVINCFYELTQSPGEASILLARQPRVLEAVTLTASIDSDSTTDSPSLSPAKRLALGTLLSLSENVRNRRILARQVGVITCLIRYTRDHDPQDSEGILTIGRDTLKEHIVKLAEAL